MINECCLKRKNVINCFEIAESLQTLKDFQVTSQKRRKLKTSVKIPELDGQRRSTK